MAEIQVLKMNSREVKIDNKVHIHINGRELPECESYQWFLDAINEKAERERAEKSKAAETEQEAKQ